MIEYRGKLLGVNERDQSIAADVFGEEWVKQIRAEHPNAPLLVTASGLFYYFEQSRVLNLFQTLKQYGHVEILFDTVNAKGMKRIGKYMKQVGHAEAAMYFYVDDAAELARRVGAKLLAEEPYYSHIEKHDFQFMTSITMKVSDRFSMVKMIHIQMNG